MSLVFEAFRPNRSKTCVHVHYKLFFLIGRKVLVYNQYQRRFIIILNPEHKCSFYLMIELDILFDLIELWRNLQKHSSNRKKEKEKSMLLMGSPVLALLRQAVSTKVTRRDPIPSCSHENI